jgi:uncharacterized protein (TIGR02246 family)
MISTEQAEALVDILKGGWNAGDGARYAEAFADDADFVTVAGMHVRGRRAIAESHDRIFTTVYRGSNVGMRIEKLRPLSDGVALMHVGATLDVPEGPFAGTMEALMTIVIDGSGDRAQIAALHNTIVRDLAQAAGRANDATEGKA